MEETAMRIGIADFTPQRPGGNASPAGNRYDESHCRNRESAGTMRRDRYPNRAGTPLASGTAGEITMQEVKGASRRSFLKMAGSAAALVSTLDAANAAAETVPLQAGPVAQTGDGTRIRPLPARRSWNWRILCRERTQHPFSRAAIRFLSSLFHSPWRTGHCNRAT